MALTAQEKAAMAVVKRAFEADKPIAVAPVIGPGAVSLDAKAAEVLVRKGLATIYEQGDRFVELTTLGWVEFKAYAKWL